jgi:O-antigen ligase
MVILSGILFNSFYIIGVLFPGASGLSIFPWVALVFLTITINNPSAKSKHLLVLCTILLLYISAIFFSGWHSYSIYKAQMFALKVVPMMLIPFILKDRFYRFLLGYTIPLIIFIAISLVASLPFVVAINVNDRLEVGLFNPIWISRAVFELLLLGIIVLGFKRLYLMLISLVAIPVVYTAGSKGPLLSFILVILIWFLSEKLVTTGQRITAALSVGLLTIGAAASFVSLSTDSYLYQRFLLQVPDGSEFIDRSRGVVWPLVIDKITNQNLGQTLLGHGLGGYESFFFGTATGERFYPHNLFLELIVENGLIVTAFLACLSFHLYRSCASPIKYLFAFAFFNAQFSGDLLLNESLFFYGAALLVFNRRHSLSKTDARLSSERCRL